MKQVSRIFKLFVLALAIVSLLAQAGVSMSHVNINTGDKAALMTLKGVGEKIAERIIAYRQKHPFKTAEEIMNVKGVGKKIFEANKDRIMVKDE